MTKVKYLVLLFAIALLILVLPNISNAATEYTYSDTEQGIEWSYELDDNENVVNLKCNTTSIIGKVTIPSTIDGKTVISLRGSYNEGAFQYCAGLTEIIIPNTITEIGSYAFSNCTGLKEVTLPYGTTYIGGEAFEKCSGLKSITIPNSVTAIGARAFMDCSGLKEIILSESLTKISTQTFLRCNKLTNVVLPDSITTLDNYAFSDCTNLEKILIPDTVASIGSATFEDCDKLTIYGNDGMTSKEYAEANNIPFDYIANWNKEEVGSDVTPPTVKSITVTNESVKKYDKDENKKIYMISTGAKLVINVEFSEIIEGTTAPTLMIKFGDGQNIKVTGGTVGGSTITYIYTVKNTDKGVMSVVDFSGGNIKDASGNTATLSCPELTIQYSSGYLVYANGTASNGDSGNQKNDNNTTTNNNSGTGSSTTTTTNNNNPGTSSSTTTTNKNNGSNSSAETKPDTTTATGKIPHAGVEIGTIATLVVVIAVGVVVYSKYNKMRDI